MNDLEARMVRITELQQRVSARDYVVDPRAVAEALLRRTDPRRDPVLLPPVIRPRADSRPGFADVRRPPAA